MQLPDFHISHAEKIEWMIDTNGWALEAVPGAADSHPPRPAHAYTIGLPALCGFAEVIVCGVAPAAANGLLGLVVDALRGGTAIPVGAELVGLLDNELRCAFAPLETEVAEIWCPTAVAWHGGAAFDVVQLVYPDRSGFLPYETGFDRSMVHAQPMLGVLE